MHRLLAFGAIVAPALHTATDIVEVAQGGFSPVQLWLNYLAFLAMPAVMLGLWARQRPGIGLSGLLGALLYGVAFVYFSHTTLVAIETGAADYAQLWATLGRTYTVHGAVMVVGGLLFGWATARAGVFPRWTAAIFLAGVVANLLVALMPIADIVQTSGTALRNAGLIGMGWATSRGT